MLYIISLWGKIKEKKIIEKKRKFFIVIVVVVVVARLEKLNATFTTINLFDLNLN